MEKIVVIDPGHGGSQDNKGSLANNAKGPNGTLEKAINLQVALLVEQELRMAGFDVYITRSTDVNPGLADRAHVARDRAALAFVSIHFNGSNAHDAQGTETHVHERNRTASSDRLASCVQNCVVAALKYRDRELRAGQWGVLSSRNHHPDTAAVLVECSFMDRADEEALLNTQAHQRKIAHAITDGVRLFASSPDAWGPKRYTAPPPVKSFWKGLFSMFENDRDT